MKTMLMSLLMLVSFAVNADDIVSAAQKTAETPVGLYVDKNKDAKIKFLHQLVCSLYADLLAEKACNRELDLEVTVATDDGGLSNQSAIHSKQYFEIYKRLYNKAVEDYKKSQANWEKLAKEAIDGEKTEEKLAEVHKAELESIKFACLALKYKTMAEIRSYEAEDNN